MIKKTVIEAATQQDTPVVGTEVLSYVASKQINVGSTQLNSAKAKMEASNFDPLEHLIVAYKDICRQIQQEERALHADLGYYGKPRRFHRVALNQLMTLQQKLLQDLMRYGYACETMQAVPVGDGNLVINLSA